MPGPLKGKPTENVSSALGIIAAALAYLFKIQGTSPLYPALLLILGNVPHAVTALVDLVRGRKYQAQVSAMDASLNAAAKAQADKAAFEATVAAEVQRQIAASKPQAAPGGGTGAQ